MDTIREVTSVFLANRRELMAFIYCLVRDHHAAEDIFQEVWIRLITALQEGKTIDDPDRWCRGTARNLILHHWRNQKNRRVIADSELIEAVELAFEENNPGDLADWREALGHCMERLPQRSRRLLSLKYEFECSINAIGQELRQSSDAVTKALLRLRRALRGCVSKRLHWMEVER